MDFSHPDLQGTAAFDADGRILARDFTDTDLADTLGHGTAVAGMIAGQARTTYRLEEPGRPPVLLRVKGVAPGVRLMSAKVFDTRIPGMGGWESAIMDGTKRQRRGRCARRSARRSATWTARWGGLAHAAGGY